MKTIFKQTFAAVLISGVASFSQANEEVPDHIIDLSPYIVSGSDQAKKLSEIIVPASVLSRDALENSKQATLGEILNGAPGMHSSGFSSGASRPIIRGFDGSRVKLLEGGMEITDVSSTSADHAVASEAYFAKSIEVIRGPATLLHGSSAIGGVVNVVDHRTNVSQYDEPLVGRAFAEYNGASEGVVVGAIATATQENWSVTVSALNRDFDDYEISVNAESEILHESEGHEDHDDDAEEHEDEVDVSTLENSFVNTTSYSVSSSWFYGNESRLSLTWNQYDTEYGVPGHSHEHAHEEDHEDEDEDHDHETDEDDHDDDAHEDEDDEDHEDEEALVYIEMERQSISAEWEHVLEPGSAFKRLSAKTSFNDYKHTEMEGEHVGTVFENESLEFRLSGYYSVYEDQPGVLGYHFNQQDFSAFGEEAFTPPSTTSDHSVYFLQEWEAETWRAEGGLRLENRNIDVDDHGDYDDTALSAALGVNLDLSESVSLAISGQHSKRHPTATELYANGPHIATSQYEIGDHDLGMETANGIDVTLKFENETFSGQMTAFITDFSDYIYLEHTDSEIDDLPVFEFTSDDATFRGFESELTWHALHYKAHRLHITGIYDTVTAEIGSSDENLPRIPPQRLGVKVLYENGAFRLGADCINVFDQDDVAHNELPTEGYTDLRAYVSYERRALDLDWRVSLGIRNLLDEEIRYHTSFTKDIAPQPGRSVVLTLSACWGR